MVKLKEIKRLWKGLKRKVFSDSYRKKTLRKDLQDDLTTFIKARNLFNESFVVSDLEKTEIRSSYYDQLICTSRKVDYYFGVRSVFDLIEIALENGLCVENFLKTKVLLNKFLIETSADLLDKIEEVR